MAVCKVFTSEEDVTKLAEGWQALQEDVGIAPFTGYDWAMAWWRTVGKSAGAKLMVVAAFEKDELIGVIPFSIRKKHGVRVLRLLGHEVYYYRSFLVREPTLMPLIWQTALEQKYFDAANIKNIHDETEEHRFLGSRANLVRTNKVYHCEDLGLSREDMLMVIAKRLRQKLRSTHRKIEQDPDLELHYCRAEPVPQDVIDFLVERKTIWAADKKKRGVFDEKDPKAFYNEVITMNAKKGSLLLYWLKYKGEFIGADFSVVEKNIVYGHTLTYDPKGAKFAPGIYLTAEVMFWASENGLIENNFMEGEEEYKRRFGKTHRIIHEYAYGRTIIGSLYLWLYRCLSFVRGLKERSAE